MLGAFCPAARRAVASMGPAEVRGLVDQIGAYALPETTMVVMIEKMARTTQ